MGALLKPEEREQVEAQARRGATQTTRRRAQVLLLYDEGLQTKDVAERVNLSPSRTRYWRRAFQADGMGIFPEAPGAAIAGSGPAPASSEPAEVEAEPAAAEVAEMVEENPPPEPLTMDEISHRNTADPARGEYLREQALTLFDATQATHQLDANQRKVLGVAARFHELGDGSGDAGAQEINLGGFPSQPVADLTPQEQEQVAAVTGRSFGKKGQRVPDKLSMRPVLEQEALALAALLRLALGLDDSRTQTTTIDAVELRPDHLRLRVSGPKAASDARAAQKQAKLWQRLFQQKVEVFVPVDVEAAPIDPGDLDSLLKLERPGVEPDDPLSEAGRKVLRYHFAEMLRHEEGTRLGEDIEELHDMRVATRRMRAAFEVFENAFDLKAVKPHLKGLRAAGRALGRVRDLDVFMEKAQLYLDSLPPEQRHGLDMLLGAWSEQREADRAEMLAHLDSPDYQNFKRKFAVFLNTPGAGARQIPEEQIEPELVRYVAPVLIYTRLAAVRAYEPRLPSASIEQLHALRIEFKKLRYTVEFFKEVMGVQAGAVIGDIKGLQDHLGDLNDADVACQILREFLDNWENREVQVPLSERSNPEPLVAYLAAKHAERHRLIVTFQEAWAHFDRPEFRENLAQAIAVL